MRRMTACSFKFSLALVASLSAVAFAPHVQARAAAGQLFSEDQELRLHEYGAGKTWSANWEGIIPSTGAQNTRVRKFRLEEGAFVFDAMPVYRSTFVRFPKEAPMEPRLAPKLYMLKGFACVEGGSKSESTFLARHNHVHLVVDPYGNHPVVYKLPSLFASCKQVRREKDGRILFEQGTYVFDKNDLTHRSVQFNEVALQDRVFRATGRSRLVQLVGEGDELKLKQTAE